MPIVYNIGDCKRCGSPRTGRVLPAMGMKGIKKEAKLAQKGVYVKYSPDSSVYNCFCYDCGVMWRAQIEPKFVPRSKIKSNFESNEYAMADIIRRKEEYLAKEADVLESWKKTDDGKKKHRVLKFMKNQFISPFESILTVVDDAKMIIGQKEDPEDNEVTENTETEETENRRNYNWYKHC